MPESSEEKKIREWINRQPLNKRLGETCLVSDWFPITDKSKTTLLESIPNVLVRDGFCRRYHEIGEPARLSGLNFNE